MCLTSTGSRRWGHPEWCRRRRMCCSMRQRRSRRDSEDTPRRRLSSQTGGPPGRMCAGQACPSRTSPSGNLLPKRRKGSRRPTRPRPRRRRNDSSASCDLRSAEKGHTTAKTLPKSPVSGWRQRREVSLRRPNIVDALPNPFPPFPTLSCALARRASPGCTPIQIRRQYKEESRQMVVFPAGICMGGLSLPGVVRVQCDWRT